MKLSAIILSAHRKFKLKFSRKSHVCICVRMNDRAVRFNSLKMHAFECDSKTLEKN